MFQNVLIGRYNVPNDGKRIIKITKEQLEKLLINDEYFLLQDIKGFDIDLVKNVKGVCRNLRVVEDGEALNLYADIKIIDPLAQNIHPLDCSFSMRMYSKDDFSLGYAEPLNGSCIKKIIGWDIKYKDLV